MDIESNRDQALAFGNLHRTNRPLVLVNAWDAASARTIEDCGAPAIATSSAAMAWSLGYSDGERVPQDEFIATVARIRRVTRLPLSVDIERGFASDAAGVRDFVQRLLDIGIAGVNIEDGIDEVAGTPRPPEPVCQRISVLRELAVQVGVALFINARTDVYFAPALEPAGRCEEAFRRAQLYVDAGADGVFLPGIRNLSDIHEMVERLDAPLNVYAGIPGIPDVDALAKAGVRRISIGCGPLQSAIALLRRIALQAHAATRFDAMLQDMEPAAAINRLFPVP
jgi:2-methylisocitrate lyase-like PEP mutase family enzyme